MSFLETYNVVRLHPFTCQEIPADFERMKATMAKEPESVGKKDCPCQVHDNDTFSNITPLQRAYLVLHWKCIQLLLQSGAIATDVIDILFHAVLEQRREIVELLLIQGAPTEDPNVIYNILYRVNFQTYILEPRSLTSIAIKNKDVDMLWLLLLHGAVMNVPVAYENIIRCYFNLSLIHAVLMLTKDAECIRKQMLIILYEFGADFHIEPHFFTYACLKQMYNIRVGVPAIEMVNEDDVPSEATYTLAAQLKKLMSTPRSMLSLSRLAVKKAMGRNYVKNLPLLDVPGDIHDLLMFKELENNNEAKISDNHLLKL